MRILLLGADGQVGHELCAMLPELGELVRTTRDGSVGMAVDLGVRDAVVGAIQETSPDLVVNAAAYTAVDEAEDEPERAQRINAEAVGVLAEACRIAGAPLVHYTTDYVFDGKLRRPYREDDAPRPLSVYGASKLAGEQAIRSSGVPHLILRTSWVYAGRGRNFLITLLRLAQEKDELNVVDDQTGTPTWARFVAEGTFRAIARLAEGESLSAAFAEAGGTYHLAAGGQATWFGFALYMLEYAAQLGLMDYPPELHPITSEEYPSRAMRPAWSVLDCNRFIQRFGWTPPAWQTGVRQCLDGLVASL